MAPEKQWALPWHSLVNFFHASISPFVSGRSLTAALPGLTNFRSGPATYAGGMIDRDISWTMDLGHIHESTCPKAGCLSPAHAYPAQPLGTTAVVSDHVRSLMPM